MGFITKDRKQLNLIGYCLDDFVEQKAKCRFVVQLVSELNLQALYDQYSDQGNDAFDPEIMLATWFFAYSEGVTSTRKLEGRCKRDLHFIYISANLQPDHSSLSRFRKRHLELISEYFVQIVRLAIGKGIAEFKSIAIDGSKIQSAASVRKSKDAETLSKYLKAVREDIAEYMQQCELSEEEGNQDVEEIKKKVSQIQVKEKRLLQYHEQLAKRKETIKPEYRDRHKINITEPDALIMDKVNGKQKLPAYNVQISVDTRSQIICANDVVQERNDQNQFSRQYENSENNLGTDAGREYTADAGYHSLEQLEYIESNQINAVVAEPHPENRSITGKRGGDENPEEKIRERFDRSDFTYNEAGDYYECPAGEKMRFERRYKRSGWEGRTYKADNCINCTYRTKCLPADNKSGVRRIHRNDREMYAEKMYEKLQSTQAKDRLKIRSTTVEPILGNLKENLGFRRFRLRGLCRVRGEFNLMCIAHNINKMYVLFMLHAFVCFLLIKARVVTEEYKNHFVRIRKSYH
jgi:transposase